MQEAVHQGLPGFEPTIKKKRERGRYYRKKY
jgi:hypothetical protein